MKKMNTLKKNYEFQNVLNRGKFYVGKQITIYIMKNREKENRIGIAVSSKSYNAVKKNHIKRKIRENYRLIADELVQGYDVIFLWNKKVSLEQLDFYKVNQDMKVIFSKAGMLK